MSTQDIYNAVIGATKRRLASLVSDSLQHLDIGAGEGNLILEFRKHFTVDSCACDFHIERFAADKVACAQLNLNNDPLPYADEQFDLVTTSEVVEHLESYRRLLREAFRVTKKGGLLVVTTPNVLNMASRVRNLFCGFANLFGPLPVRHDEFYSTSGHIMPIPYFYLAHALMDAGFERLELDIDKTQKTSVFWLILLFPFIALGWWRFMRQEQKRYKTITAENKAHVKAHFSWQMLVGRTIVVSAFKPENSNAT
ncbi:MAG: Methyltransferase type 11 [Proteobacteria bacterium]|nr:Methyltransferase type 11 [Pseudomonadota bacterium]